MAKNTNNRIAVKWVRDKAKAAYVKQGSCYICGGTVDLSWLMEKLEKDGEIGKDDLSRGEKELEKITSDHVAKIDALLKHKETELLEV